MTRYSQASSKSREWAWLLAAAAIMLLPKILDSSYLYYMLSMLMVYTVFALGVNVFFGHCGQVSFGHQGFYAIGAYSVALLVEHWSVPMVVSLMAASSMATIVSIVVGLPILRLRSVYLALGTFCFGMIIYYMAEQWVALTGGVNGLMITRPTILGYELAREQLYYVSAFFGLASFIACYLLIRSRVGRAFKSIRDNEVAAGSCGIRVFMYRLAALGYSAFLCGLAGGLHAYNMGWISSADFGVELAVIYLTMLVVGGLGTNVGQFLGAAFVVFMPELLFGMEQWRVLVNGVALALVVLFMPEGFASALSRIGLWLYKRWLGIFLHARTNR